MIFVNCAFVAASTSSWRHKRSVQRKLTKRELAALTTKGRPRRAAGKDKGGEKNKEKDKGKVDKKGKDKNKKDKNVKKNNDKNKGKLDNKGKFGVVTKMHKDENKNKGKLSEKGKAKLKKEKEDQEKKIKKLKKLVRVIVKEDKKINKMKAKQGLDEKSLTAKGTYCLYTMHFINVILIPCFYNCRQSSCRFILRSR